MKSILVVACMALFTGAVVPGQEPSTSEWTTRAELPEIRTEISAAADGRRIYLAGGFGPPASAGERAAAPRRLWIYDPSTDEWSSPTELPEGVHHAGMVHLDGRIYIVGGFRETSFEPVGHVRIYDIAANAWRDGRPSPTPRGAGAIAVLNGRIHWIGGNAAAGS
jgi:hypothetical protein